MSERSSCELCGNESPADIAAGLAEWAKPVGRDRFAKIIRCRDKAACRGRADAAKRAWPLVEERTTA